MPSSGMLARIPGKTTLLDIDRANTYQGVEMHGFGRRIKDSAAGGQ
jgi:hypothetical protein